jgi:hypothetical protein
MPAPNNRIMTLRIQVTLTGSPSFTIDAGEQPGQLDFNGEGGQGVEDQALLKEVLAKIMVSYPHHPITLCLDGNDIVPGSLCPGGTPAAVPPAAVAPPAPKKAPLKKTAPKKAAPKAHSRRKGPKKPS